MHLVKTLGLQYFEKAKITQYNIEYRLQYSLFLTTLNYHRNRLFLYFLVNYRNRLFLYFLVNYRNRLFLYFLVNYRNRLFLYFFQYRFPTLAYHMSSFLTKSNLSSENAKNAQMSEKFWEVLVQPTACGCDDLFFALYLILSGKLGICGRDDLLLAFHLILDGKLDICGPSKNLSSIPSSAQ